MKATKVVTNVIVRNRNGEILVLRRSETDPRRPLTWDFPGGIVEYEEDIQAAAIREVREETGLEITGLKPMNVSTANREYFYIFVVYTAECSVSDVKLSFEHDQFKWVKPAELQTIDWHPRFKLLVGQLASAE